MGSSRAGAGVRGTLSCVGKMRALLLLLFLSSLELIMSGRLIRLRDTSSISPLRKKTWNSHRERCRKFVFAPDCRGIQSKRSGTSDFIRMYRPTKRSYFLLREVANLSPWTLRPNFGTIEQRLPLKEVRGSEAVLSY